MTTYQELSHAISVLEKQKSFLEPNVFNISVSALQEKIASMASQSNGAQYAQISMLVADLSGFTAMSELRDAEEVRDTMNEVWQKLDSVIESWGGRVDKHVGDALIAIFGVPQAHEDDPERAVQAALDMQMELALFNERAVQIAAENSWMNSPAQLRMRIGIHSGPVVIGQMGSRSQKTAVGDTVNIANQLEKNAPVEGVLISHAVYRQTQHLFDLEEAEPIVLQGKPAASEVYVVKREKSRPYYTSIRGVKGIQTRIIGRNDELQLLQDVLQTTIDRSVAQVVTILGNAGVGKSRLLYEFERLMALLPHRVAVLRGRVHQGMAQAPYSLFRDLLATHFDIHRRNSPGVAKEKFVRGVIDMMGEAPKRAKERAHLIGQLLGFDFSDSVHVQNVGNDPRLLRERAFQEMAALLTAVSPPQGAAVLFLEDLHWADEGSFDRLDYLVERSEQVPLMVACLARPEVLRKRPSWEMVESLNSKTYHRIMLPSLSSIDSRHLTMDILQNVPQLPLRLLDLIVTRANGNPFQIEELIEMLIEFEVIVPNENRWQIELINMPPIGVEPTLSYLVQLRMEKLPDLEQMVLQKASVLGRIFWDRLVCQLVQADVASFSNDQVLEALYSLEQSGWIYRRRLSTFADTPEYAFRHDSLNQAIYEAIDLDTRSQTHGAVAKWLVTYEGVTQKEAFAAIVAHHFKLAQDVGLAADWFHRAAQYAEQAYMPETAIAHYQQALHLLSSSAQLPSKCFELNRGLGEMLEKQARFEEAIAAFLKMKEAAFASKDQQAEMEAYRALLLVYGLQGDFRLMLPLAQEAEKVARAVNDVTGIAFALASQAWAYVATNQIRTAVSVGKEALKISSAANSPFEIAYSNAILGNIGRMTNHFKGAIPLVEKARQLFHDNGERKWEALMLANLGHISQLGSDFGHAISFYTDSLRIARDIGDYFSAILSLRRLGGIVQQQQQQMFIEAKAYYERALVYAEKSGNVAFRADIANDIGQMYLNWATISEESVDVVDVEAYMQEAYLWFNRAVELGQSVDKPMSIARAHIGIAQLKIEDDQLEDAMDAALKAIEVAKTAVFETITVIRAKKVLATAWRTLAIIAYLLPDDDLPIQVGGGFYSIRDCFTQSLQYFTECKHIGLPDKAETMQVLAIYESEDGDKDRSKALLRESEKITGRLSLSPKNES